MIDAFETGSETAWSKNPTLPMDGRIIEVGDYFGARKAFFNHLTHKWRSYPEGYLIVSGDEVWPIQQWRETGFSVLIDGEA